MHRATSGSVRQNKQRLWSSNELRLFPNTKVFPKHIIHIRVQVKCALWICRIFNFKLFIVKYTLHCEKSFSLHSGDQNTRIFGDKYVCVCIPLPHTAYVCLKRYVLAITGRQQALSTFPCSTLAWGPQANWLWCMTMSLFSLKVSLLIHVIVRFSHGATIPRTELHCGAETV